MSVDPSAIIVGVAAAIGGFVHGADLPEPAQGIATQQVQSIVEAAPALGAQIDESIAGLPPPKLRIRLVEPLTLRPLPFRTL